MFILLYLHVPFRLTKIIYMSRKENFHLASCLVKIKQINLLFLSKEKKKKKHVMVQLLVFCTMFNNVQRISMNYCSWKCMQLSIKTKISLIGSLFLLLSTDQNEFFKLNQKIYDIPQSLCKHFVFNFHNLQNVGHLIKILQLGFISKFSTL